MAVSAPIASASSETLMPPYVTLAEHPSDMVRLACTKCERGGQYRKATLIERYGPDQNMVDLRLILAAGCPKIAGDLPPPPGPRTRPVRRRIPPPRRSFCFRPSSCFAPYHARGT
jgi:hypothetical protein